MFFVVVVKEFVYEMIFFRVFVVFNDIVFYGVVEGCRKVLVMSGC